MKLPILHFQGEFKVLLSLLCFLSVCLVNVYPLILPVHAQEGQIDQVHQEIEQLQAKLDEIKSEKQSLSQTIKYITTNIQLTETEIRQTNAEINVLENEIQSLLGKIGLLDVNLEKITSVLVSRITTSYKNTKTEPMQLLLLSNGFKDFFRRIKYLKVSQQHDRDVIFALEEARANYDKQKQIKEEKQSEVVTLQAKLIAQKASLDGQKNQKQVALRVTQNDEKKYQDQLAKALAELSAIQSIIAGKGSETEVGVVKEGSVIASIIPSSSTCSTGAHLHFEVVKDSAHTNPASYLSSKNIVWDNDPDGSFGFTGSWRWPVDDPIRITQGYGMTFYASTLRFYGGAPHTGIDMISSTGYNVRAVKDGTLYRGGIACKGGTLRYVHVKHADGLDTFYLHVDY